jgi:hypothetical protein
MGELSCGLRQKIIQIHPLLRCNLFCSHRYSSSGPDAVKQKLDLGTLIQIIDDAHKMGYEVASFSGGEPFMYESHCTCKILWYDNYRHFKWYVIESGKVKKTSRIFGSDRNQFGWSSTTLNKTGCMPSSLRHPRFMNYHKRPGEESFCHDVSNPFDFPHIKYVDLKPFLIS